MGNQTTKQSGKDKPKKNVHWKTAEPPSPPGKPVLVPGTPDTAPDIVTIRWLRPPSDGGSPIIGYLVEHRRTGSPHWVRATPQLIQLTQLSLTGLEPGWRYQFRVIAENAIGKGDYSEISDPLTVTLQRNAITAPKFTHEIFDTTAVENDKVEFRVAVDGTPAPQISWFKDGFEIFSSRRTKIVNESNVSVLVIHQAALTDEGEIKCSATNRAGHVVTRGHLSIEAYPKIRLPRQYEDGLILEAEEVVRLKVGLAGRPPPTVYWSHNGEEIVDGPRYEISTNDKNSTLKIAQSQRDDRGEYSIRAVNKLGEDNISFLVTITARPEPPGKVIVNMTLGKSVTISWTPPVDDGGCKIGNYIVEYFRIGWNVWLKAATCRQLSTTLNDLIEGSEYKFRVKAENPYGLSDPGEESDVLFIADPKRGITDPDKIKTVELEENAVAPTAVPRKRRDLSKSPGRDLDEDKPTKKIKPFSPEIFDQHELQRDMSYGASDEFFKVKENSNNNLLHVSKRSNEMSRSDSPIPEVTVTTDFPSEERLGRRPEKMDIDHPNNQLTATDKAKRTGHSSEFMLVLYDQGSKSNARNTHFDFELDELVAPPPPLSLSAPDLSLEPPTLPTMRHAVSSTELLYERAMARFYQAVAFEESENARKHGGAVSPHTEEVLRRRSFSMDHQQRLRKHSGGKELLQIPRQLSLSESSEHEEKHSEKDKQETETLVEPPKIEEKLSDTEMIVEDEAEEEEEEEELSEDSVIEEYSKLEQKIKSGRHNEQEDDTYHPMYAPQDPSQAVEILTKPLRLPNPNFVPKPILKRPSTEVLEQKPSSELSNIQKEVTPSSSSLSSLSTPTPSIIDEKKSDVQELLPMNSITKNYPEKLEPLKVMMPKKLEPARESPEKQEPVKELTKKEKKRLKEEEKKREREEREEEKRREKEEREEEKRREKEEKKRQSMNQSERISLKKLLDFSPFGKNNNKEKKEEEKKGEENKAEENKDQVIMEEKKIENQKITEMEIDKEIDTEILPPELTNSKRTLQKQKSEEEYHAVANFYDDIVRDRSNPLRKENKVPLYLNPKRLQQIEVSDEEPEQKPLETKPVEPPKKPDITHVKLPSPVKNIENRKFVVVENNVHAPVAPTENHAFTDKTVPKKKTVRSSSKTRKATDQTPDRARSTSKTRKTTDQTPDGVRSPSKTRKAVDQIDGEPKKTRKTVDQTDGEPKKTKRAPSKTRLRSESKSPSRTGQTKMVSENKTEPEVEEEATKVKVKQVRVEEIIVHHKVKTTLAYFTDISLFLLACWLYIFKKPILAVPVLMLIVYRNIQDIIKERMPGWLKFS